MNFGPQMAQNLTCIFYLSSVNSAFCFITRLRTWRWSNRTQPNFAKAWTV